MGIIHTISEVIFVLIEVIFIPLFSKSIYNPVFCGFKYIFINQSLSMLVIKFKLIDYTLKVKQSDSNFNQWCLFMYLITGITGQDGCFLIETF